MPLATFSRRRFVQGLSWSTALLTSRGLFAEELMATPQMTEGPFYPDKLPLDTDNDLVIVNDHVTPAVGEITHLTGRVMNAHGEPVRNAFMEIWQVDNQGVYLHRGSNARDRLDANFQGYGRFLTGSTGEYYFRTIKPVPYPGRAPHIHVGISQNGHRIFTTQLLINGHPQNNSDGVFRSVTDPLARETVLVNFDPLPGSKIGELQARFDIVMGITPQEDVEGQLRGGIGKPERDGGGRRG